jgi:Cd2+/Zn2+-exporting ATPase
VKNSRCVIHELAQTLAGDKCLRAVVLDAERRRISFACMPGCDSKAKQQQIEEALKPFRPEDTPGCLKEARPVPCELCEQGRPQAMPEGIRMVALPGSGILLERASCETAHRVWKWNQFPWLQVKPIVVPEVDHHDWKLPLALAAVCGVATLAGFITEKTLGQLTPLALAAYVVAYLSGSWHAAEETWELLRKRILDIHFLMLCVAAGAAVIGHWWEGAVLMFLFSLSGALEDYAMQRTEREINSLFKAAPKQATLLTASGEERLVAVDELQAGATLLVRPGEQFPVDAEVLKGTSASDESNLTGEAIPVDKTIGDQVLAGTLNLWGRLDCKVLRPAAESSLSKIIRLIREAQDAKAPAQRFTDKFGTTYTYGILGVSILMFFVWWKIWPTTGPDPSAARNAFYRTMTLLVVASPCALVLSIPSAVLAGIAAAARRGILFRGGVALEKLAEIRRVALDKTGTLTTGLLQVRSVEAQPAGREDDLLARAAALAHNSTHPVSQAVVRAARAHTLVVPPATDFRSLTGSGVQANVDGRAAQLGRRSLMGHAAWLARIPEPQPGLTEVLYADGEVQGRFLLEDQVRTSSRPLLAKLYDAGLHLTMLSGDRKEAVQGVAEQVGLREFEFGLSPDEKVARIKHWTEAGEKPAMVGDGVNDAPSLAAAYVGVAMGMRGSDAALEQADVVLMKDRLDRFYVAYELSRRARRIIRQNLAVSLGSVVVLVAGAFAGVIPLTIGVIGHEGSTVVVVLNSLRLLLMRFEEDHTAGE